jgi:hypothetical protein
MSKYRFSEEKRIKIMTSEKYKVYFTGLKHTYGAALQNLMFLIDRIATANILLTCREEPIVSCCLILTWKIMEISYFLKYRPYKSKLENQIEMLNDTASVFVLYLLMAYQAVIR